MIFLNETLGYIMAKEMNDSNIRYNPWEGTITFDMPPRFSDTMASVHSQSRIIEGEVVETTYLLENANGQRNGAKETREESAHEIDERETHR